MAHGTVAFGVGGNTHVSLAFFLRTGYLCGFLVVAVWMMYEIGRKLGR